MVNCFNSLGHDTVISRNDQNCNIRYHCATQTHRREGFVAGGIEEGDVLTLNVNSVSADVLGDAARFGCSHVCISDPIQKRGLAVVNVTHNDNDGASFNEIFFSVLFVNDEALLDCYDDFLFDLCAKLFCNECGGVKVNSLIERCKYAKTHQLFNNFGCCNL